MEKWVPGLDTKGAFPFCHIKIDSEVNTLIILLGVKTPKFVLRLLPVINSFNHPIGRSGGRSLPRTGSEKAR